MAAAAANRPIQRLNRASGASLYQFSGHSFGPLNLTGSPDGTSLARAGQYGATRLWDVAQGVKVAMFEGGADWGEHVAWSRLGTLAATATGKPLKL